MSRPRALSSTVLFTLIVAGCSEGTGPGGTPPGLPEDASMEFDLSFFTGTPSVAAPAGPALVAGTNWTAAALAVTVAKLAVVVHTAIPLATWRVARAQVPVLEDGQWHWRFTTVVNAQSFSGDLTGYLENNELIAEMRISSTALGLDDFLWYVGTAPVGGTTGTWEFFDPQAPSTLVGSIDWSHPGTLVWTVSFTVEAGPDVGDELTYDVNGAARSVTFSDASAATTAVIEWNATTHAGSITAPNFNGGVKACWDTTLANVTCP
jgi:hypothetical protein